MFLFCLFVFNCDDAVPGPVRGKHGHDGNEFFEIDLAVLVDVKAGEDAVPQRIQRNFGKFDQCLWDYPLPFFFVDFPEAEPKKFDFLRKKQTNKNNTSCE